MTTSQGTERAWRPLAVLTIGFLAIATGIYAAHRRPATGYEVSIYRGTPLSFWIGCATALISAILVTAVYRRYAPLSLFLGGLSVFSIASLPILRGYYYYGWGDGLTHLGWAREIAADQNPLELFYPGPHLSAVAIHTLGFDLRHAMMLVTVLFVLLFLVFVPLTVRTVVPDRTAVAIAAFAGFLLLPIFQFGTSYLFIPYSLAMLFSVFVLYLLARHVIAPIRDSPRSTVPAVATGGLLTLAGTTLVLTHSQLMADVLVLLGGIVGLQLLYRRYQRTHPVAGHRLVAVETGVLVLVFAVWNLHHGIMFRVVNGILSAVTGRTDAGVASTVGQRGGSLSDVGASLLEIFVKLFLVNTIFALLAGGLVIAVLLGRSTRLPTRARQLVLYLGVGGILLLPLFLLHVAGVSASFFFRHVGFGMVLATVIGALGLYHLVDVYDSPVGWPATTGLTAVALALALLVVFPSPYIYLANHHVTEAQMEGYERTFDAHDEDIQWAGIRLGPGRFSSAYPGATEDAREGRIDAVANENVNSSMIDAGIASQFDRDTYLVVTRADHDRELVAFRGLRYSRADFEAIEGQENLSRIAANGEFTLYYVHAER